MIAIACVEKNFGIGKNGALLVQNPLDMSFFVRATKNQIVVLGRKTYENLPTQPLPHRINIILSASMQKTSNPMAPCLENPDFEVLKKNVWVANDLADLRKILQSVAPLGKEIFVCGGQKTYDSLLPYCTHAFVNKIDSVLAADTHMPNLDRNKHWALLHKQTKHQIDFCVYENQAVVPFL